MGHTSQTSAACSGGPTLAAHAGSGRFTCFRLAAPRREPCAGMLAHGMAPFAASLDNSQRAGAIPICHHLDVNNVLALNN